MILLPEVGSLGSWSSRCTDQLLFSGGVTSAGTCGWLIPQKVVFRTYCRRIESGIFFSLIED